MNTKMTRNGVTTTNGLGQEQYEFFKSAFGNKKRVHYDYRHTDGKLFSTVAHTLEEARQRRDIWLAAREVK